MTFKSILIVNMNYLGDALMTTPTIRALKRTYPGVVIDVIAGSTASYGALEILALDPDIDHLIPRVNGDSIARGKQLYQVIVNGKYDLVLILPTLPFYSFIARLTGRRVIMVPKADETKHMADHMLDSVKSFLPIVEAPHNMVLDVPHLTVLSMSKLLNGLDQTRRTVALSVGASRPQKRWPAAHFARTAVMAASHGFNVLLLGGGNEQDMSTAAEVMCAAEKSGNGGNVVVDLVGKTTIEQLSAAIRISDVLVTCDTGSMHIGSGLGTPLVALFGSTSPKFTGPYGEERKAKILDLHLPCAPCGTHPTCNGRYDCMTGIEPDHVLQSILELMSLSEEPDPCRIL